MRFYLIDLMYVNEWGPRAHADLTPSLIRRLYNLPLSPPTATHCFKFTHRHPLAPPYGMNSPAVPLWHHPLLCTHPPPPTGTTRCCVFTRCCLLSHPPSTLHHHRRRPPDPIISCSRSQWVTWGPCPTLIGRQGGAHSI